MKTGEQGAIDRYVTFMGIDGEGNSRRLLAMLIRHIDDPSKTNPFWEKFRQKLGTVDAGGGPGSDALFLVHSYINNFYELFEQYDDQEALQLLRRIEMESC